MNTNPLEQPDASIPVTKPNITPETVEAAAAPTSPSEGANLDTRSTIDQDAINSIRKSLETTPSTTPLTDNDSNTEIKHTISPVLPIAEPAPVMQPEVKSGIVSKISKILNLFKRNKGVVVPPPPLPENVVSFEEKREKIQSLIPPETKPIPSEPATITNMQNYLHEKDVNASLANAEKGGEWVPATDPTEKSA